jgi:hypothetical protein
MVRFSDMLGGSGEPDDANAPESPYAALANDARDPEADELEADAEDAPGPEPQAPAAPEPDPDQPLAPVGDDFLPTSKGIIRRGGRGRKRHP